MFSSPAVRACSDPTLTQTNSKNTFLWDYFSASLAEN